jgi:hypothetical protein
VIATLAEKLVRRFKESDRLPRAHGSTAIDSFVAFRLARVERQAVGSSIRFGSDRNGRCRVWLIP